ncbi:MAG TPA: hypothetical protein VFB27_10475 [Opitutaceae bacterium]|nr:hypothetical protein [Opitutaceae bacterium]
MDLLVADSLWTDFEPMSVLGMPLGRRMAVGRGDAGQLLIEFGGLQHHALSWHVQDGELLKENEKFA